MTRPLADDDCADCLLLRKLWTFLWNQGSGQFYLPNIFANGLNWNGIQLPPLREHPVGPIGPVNIYKDKKWGTVTLELSGMLSGMASVNQGTLTCSCQGETTVVGIGLTFGQLEFSGNYTVGGSGVAGCAVTGVGNLLNIFALADASGVEGDDHLALATWYRDDPNGLRASANGRTLIGMYYLHEDTIQDLLARDDGYVQNFKTSMGSTDTGATAKAVVTATAAYRKQQTLSPLERAVGVASDPLPTIGTPDQFSNGYLNNGYLGAAAQAAAGGSQDPDNEYVSLLNSMSNFYNAVAYVQNLNGAPVAADTLLQQIAAAPPDAGLNGPGLPIYDLETGEVKQRIAARPLDHELIEAALTARGLTGEDTGLKIFGQFDDQGSGVTITLDISVATVGNSLQVTVTHITLDIWALRIHLSNSPGWANYQTLYTEVSNWVAQTAFFQDAVRTKLNDALNDQKVLDWLSKTLNAGLQKLA